MKKRKFVLKQNQGFLEILRNGKVLTTFGVPADVRRALELNQLWPTRNKARAFYVRDSETAWGSLMVTKAANGDDVWILFDVRVCSDDSRLLRRLFIKAGLPKAPAYWLDRIVG